MHKKTSVLMLPKNLKKNVIKIEFIFFLQQTIFSIKLAKIYNHDINL